MEIWKDVKDFEGYYEVSSEGRIRRIRRIRSVDRVVEYERRFITDTHGFIRLYKARQKV